MLLSSAGELDQSIYLIVINYALIKVCLLLKKTQVSIISIHESNEEIILSVLKLIVLSVMKDQSF